MHPWWSKSPKYSTNVGKLVYSTHQKLEGKNPEMGIGYIKSNLEGQIKEQKW